MIRFILVCLLFIFSCYASNWEHDGSVIIKLTHSLKANGVFTERGNITIQSLRTGQAIVNQSPLTPEDQIALRDLAAKNQFYQMRALVIANDGSERSFISTLKACMLAEAELDDRLSVSLDYNDRVIGVTQVIASKSTCEGAEVPLSNLKQFSTSVYVRHTETGPIPNTTSSTPKQECEKGSKDCEEPKDNRSFLAKYWMYILPVVIIMVISSATSQEPQGPQQ